MVSILSKGTLDVGWAGSYVSTKRNLHLRPWSRAFSEEPPPPRVVLRDKSLLSIETIVLSFETRPIKTSSFDTKLKFLEIF